MFLIILIPLGTKMLFIFSQTLKLTRKTDPGIPSRISHHNFIEFMKTEVTEDIFREWQFQQLLLGTNVKINQIQSYY